MTTITREQSVTPAQPQAKPLKHRSLQGDAARLKFDLATHLGHKVLHEGDGLKSAHATGGEMGGSPEGGARLAAGMSAQDVLHVVDDERTHVQQLWQRQPVAERLRIAADRVDAR